MIQRYRGLFRIAGIALSLISLGYIIRQLWLAWPQLAGLTVAPLPVVLALLCGCGCLTLFALLWGLTLTQLDAPLTAWQAIRIWFLSQIVRYAPGNIWHLLGRAYLAR
ncbi:MAG: hypothetical protein HC837_13245 [Chloroflexaceae bacterium]|nr:hypothetical protein [Chloroflexaceae bacterium]